MNNVYLAIVGILISGLTTAAHAEAPVLLSDWQMEAVTAGSAKVVTTFHTSAVGRNTAILTSVANISAERSHGSVAQSRTAVLATGTGKAALATDVVSQSAANGYGTAQVATASTAGSAKGDIASVRSVGVTTAISASAGSPHSSIGIANSLADVTTFSASGKSH
jgi:hypothetical protein